LTPPIQKIGLALSGGGIRAMAYHCGVLRRLAETGRLEAVSQVSTVSGGSLFIGLVLASNDWKWPISDQYIELVHPKIRNLLTNVDLQSKAMKRLFHPKNWKYLLSRANVFSQCIEKYWEVTANLGELPESPTWSINGTTAETGRRFRFKQDDCGDYELGYASASNFKVADAMAVSASFPLGIGPFVIHSSDLIWWKRKTWAAFSSETEQVRLAYPKLHLYDGGVYDNLGLEPLFDIGNRKLKSNANYLIVSDAGMPLARKSLSGPMSPFRLKRIFDISLDLSRSLRIRSLSNYFQNTPNAGVYLQIGADPKARINAYKANNEEMASELLLLDWLCLSDVEKVAKYPTTLSKLDPSDFDLIERHAYETAYWNEKLFSIKCEN